MTRITPYKEYLNNPEKNKMLMKCLYVIEYLIEDKVDDLYQAFEERQEMFEDIMKVYIHNKKIGDIIKHILKLFGNENSNYYMSVESHNERREKQEQSNQQSNVNLLNIENDEPVTNVNLLEGISGGNNNVVSGGNAIDLLGGIFGGNGNSDIGIGNINEGNKEGNNDSQKKGFSFIKSKSTQVKNNNMPQQSEQPKKKGFDFIKGKSTSHQQGQDINNIFAQPQQNAVDIFNQNQSDTLSSIFNAANNTSTETKQESAQQTAIPTIDLTKMKSTYSDNNTVHVLQPQQPAFNYDLVYQNTEILKPKTNQNDPFNFVDEMIKPKK